MVFDRVKHTRIVFRTADNPIQIDIPIHSEDELRAWVEYHLVPLEGD